MQFSGTVGTENKSAAKNDVRATAALAWLYLKGVGAPIDEKKAAVLFEKAANMGDAYSQDQFGMMLGQGTGMNAEPEKAFLWIEKAANQQYPVAEYHMAMMYLTGS